jgi:hypothetical protein
LGGVSQDLYRGDSVEQLYAIVDLLANYDEYAMHRSTIAPLVRANAEGSKPTDSQNVQPEGGVDSGDAAGGKPR